MAKKNRNTTAEISGEIDLSGSKSKTNKKCQDPREYSEVMRAEKPARNPLGAYMPFPRYVVEIQDPQEQLLLLVRRHFITNWRWMLIAIMMGLGLYVVGQFSGLSMLPKNFQVMTGVFWMLLIVAVVIEGFLNWYFDVFIITDERVIDIDFRNLIYKNISSTKLDRVEDVTYSVSGAIASVLDYGNVLVQTAGTGIQLDQGDTSPALEIRQTPHPARVAKLVNELLLQEEQEKIEGRVR